VKLGDANTKFFHTRATISYKKTTYLFWKVMQTMKLQIMLARLKFFGMPSKR
jgi:hypothetical protein